MLWVRYSHQMSEGCHMHYAGFSGLVGWRKWASVKLQIIVCSDLVTLTYLLLLDENIKFPEKLIVSNTDRGGDVVSDLSCSFPPGHSRWGSRPNNLAQSLISPASRHRLRTVQQGNAQWSDWKEPWWLTNGGELTGAYSACQSWQSWTLGYWCCCWRPGTSEWSGGQSAGGSRWGASWPSSLPAPPRSSRQPARVLSTSSAGAAATLQRKTAFYLLRSRGGS